MKMVSFWHCLSTSGRIRASALARAAILQRTNLKPQATKLRCSEMDPNLSVKGQAEGTLVLHEAWCLHKGAQGTDVPCKHLGLHPSLSSCKGRHGLGGLGREGWGEAIISDLENAFLRNVVTSKCFFDFLLCTQTGTPPPTACSANMGAERLHLTHAFNVRRGRTPPACKGVVLVGAEVHWCWLCWGSTSYSFSLW
jgi:hypothetical protein